MTKNSINNRLVIIVCSLLVACIAIDIATELYKYFSDYTTDLRNTVSYDAYLYYILHPIFGIIFDFVTWTFGLKIPAPEEDFRYGSYLNRSELIDVIFLPRAIVFKILFLCLYVKIFRDKNSKKLALLMMAFSFWGFVVHCSVGFNIYVYFLSDGSYFFALKCISIFLYILSTAILALQLTSQYFERYISVHDVSSRKEFWIINTFFLLLIGCTYYMTWSTHNNSGYASIYGVLILLAYPSFALDFRRCNDLHISRWIVLFRLIPIISIFQFLYFGFAKSKISSSAAKTVSHIASI